MVGCFIGMLVGIFISLNLTTIIKYIENIVGHSILSGDVYFIDFYPLSCILPMYFMSC